MKKYCISIFLILLVATTLLSAEKTVYSYKYAENIAYRDPNIEKLDDYAIERCKLDIYYPENLSSVPVVVWFHGGGLKSGCKSMEQPLKEQQIVVVAVNYRLFPKVRCSACVDDAAAAIAWTFKNIKKYNGNPDKIFVAGHSAGGYLTAMTGLDKKWLAKYGIDADKIAGLIPFSGHTITHMTVREQRGISCKQPIIDEFAPLYHVRPDAPALILITGDRNLEMLGRYEENAYMMRMMKIAGHKKTYLYELQGFNHGQMVQPAHTILLNYIKSQR